MDFLDPNMWLSLLTLVVLEIVLGIDNIVFISILTSKLPKEKQDNARKIGLILALVSRILLLLSLTWVMRLTAPLFTIFAQEISGRDIILLVGGCFLMYKSTMEIHERFDELEHAEDQLVKSRSFLNTLVQIMILDIVFSLDSVITAVGMVSEVSIMITAIIISVIFMIYFSKHISDFIDEHPTIKILALSFLILIGMVLVAEGLDMHIPKGFIYFAMAFAISVESVNISIHKKKKRLKAKT